MSTQPQPQVSPALFFKTARAYQETEVLRAAIELDVFTAIDEGATDIASIARRCQGSARGIRILCDFLTVLGFLAKQEQRYSLTPDSAMFLSRRSPACLGSAIRFIGSGALMERYRTMAEAVRKGGTVLGDEGVLLPENPLWVEFARAMKPLMAMPAEGIARLVHAEEGEPWKVLDIAAGHGIFGITIARRNPNARIVAADWPNVLEVARENAAAAGVSSRYTTLPGSAFEVDFGRDYDLVLLTNFLHHFDPTANEGLLRKVHAALKPGGRAVTLDFVPNEDRITPLECATFSATMLVGTASGDAYTFSELDRMFRNAGFARNELHELPPTVQRVIVSERQAEAA